MNTTTTTTTTLVKAQKLASTFESLASSYPTPLLIYETGEILYQYRNTTTNNNNNNANNVIQSSFESVLEYIPVKELHSILNSIEQAFIKLVLQRKDDKQNDDVVVIQALKNICGIYSCSKLSCKLRINKQQQSSSHSFIGVLCNVLEELHEEDYEIRNLICEILCSMIQYGLITNNKNTTHPSYKNSNEGEDESDLNRIIQTCSDVISSFCLMALLQFQQQNKSLLSFRDLVEMEFPEDSVEKRYVLQLFQYHPVSTAISMSTRQKDETTTTSFTNDTAETSNDNNNPVQQISQMFSNYGLGFIETALACYGYDIEQTISALLLSEENKNEIHPRLRFLDKNLPSIQKKSAAVVYTTPDAQVAQEQKDAWKNHDYQYAQDSALFEKALRETEFTIENTINNNNNEDSLYNDDYDDQYDNSDNKAGGVCYEDDDEKYNAILVYNRVLKEDEKEEAFWNENQNLNRAPKQEQLSKEETDKISNSSTKPNIKKQTTNRKKPNNTINKNPKKQQNNNNNQEENTTNTTKTTKTARTAATTTAPNEQSNKKHSNKHKMQQHRIRKNAAYKRTEPTS